ncbi:Cna B domain protein [Gloeothece citriformis PCC 7424]|uniref:Cna B domain protein n=1 Tax=Gloeothece citriformis (strain PCC 7424) TaxID=65393 RepID=B7KH72_GLOC7|nr:SdrD B-like domain-containing protein [Gloeothece citriformis]ACK69281.1 Cna B domain protein [Gloeothece citriformis PCC 7424]
MSDLSNFSISLPEQVTFTFTNPGLTFGNPSYLDINVSGGTVLDGSYDAHCIDTDRPLSLGKTYQAKVFSSYETLPPELLGTGNIEQPQNFDLINWIINQNFVGKTAANGQLFTYGDVQRAIWTLIDDINSTSRLGGWNQTRTNQILALAQANGEGFIPTFEYTTIFGENIIGKLGVILAPDGTNDGILNPDAQIIITEVKLSKIGNFVFNDINGDGIQDEGEDKIVGVTVNLLADVDGNGVIENGEVIQSSVTDADGKYHFEVVAGNYKIQFEQPQDFSEISPRLAGIDTTQDSDGLISDVITIKPGEYDPTIDAGFYNNTGIIGDRVWFDNDGDGIQDQGENGINGVLLKLINNDTGETIATDITEGDGEYLFDSLPQGNYTIMVDPSTLPGNLQQTADSDGILDGMSTVNLPAAQSNLNQDFGYQQLGTIGDRVWFDQDRDGVQDEGENGINGVTVKLLDATGNIVATTLTGNNPNSSTLEEGYYAFTNVTPGDYRVMFVQPDGFNEVSPFQAGSNSALDSDANPANGLMSNLFTLAPGEINSTLDAGFYNCGPCVFEISNGFSGTNIKVQISMEEIEGGVKFTVTETDPNLIGDIRGLFFHINDESLLKQLKVNGSDITDYEFKANSVQDLGNGVNMNGDGNIHKYDIGIEFGTQGISQDDIQSTTFIISHKTVELNVEDFLNQEFGVRLTSVGQPNSREQSSKIFGYSPEDCCDSIFSNSLLAMNPIAI